VTATHAAQHAVGGVLERHVHVRHDGRVVREEVDEGVVELFRIEIEEADPAHARKVRDAPHDARECLTVVEIPAVRDRILRHEVQLEHAGIHQPARLVHDVVGAPRPLLAADLRDHAERALAIASLRELQVRARAAGAHEARVGGRHDPLRRVTDEHAIGAAGEHALELQHVARAEEMIDLGQVFLEVARVPLAQATRDDELPARPVLPVPRELEDRVDRFLLRRVDEPARVHDDDLRGARIVDVAEPRTLGDAEHDLGVDAVLRATETHEVDGPGHGRFRV
jgi:hypothetical protein